MRRAAKGPDQGPGPDYSEGPALSNGATFQADGDPSKLPSREPADNEIIEGRLGNVRIVSAPRLCLSAHFRNRFTACRDRGGAPKVGIVPDRQRRPMLLTTAFTASSSSFWRRPARG
jgi:hypothetical protein